MVWACSICTIENEDSAHRCDCCGEPKQTKKEEKNSSLPWKCENCSMENEPSNSRCDICGEPKTTKSQDQGKELKESHDSEDISDNELMADEKINYHENLLRDIELFRSKFGKQSVQIREFPSLNSINLQLLVDVSFLNSTACAAWRVKKELPLVVQLKIEQPEHYPGNTPKIEISQPSFEETELNQDYRDEYGMRLSKKEIDEINKKKKKKACGISHQVTSIVSQFLNDHWTSKNEGVSVVFPKKEEPKKSTVDLNNPSIKALVEMGFEPEIADKALKMKGGDLTQAADALLTNPESVLSYQPPRVEDWNTGAIMKPLSKEKDPKIVPPKTEGSLIHIAEYVRKRIPSLSDYCVICDRMHVFGPGSMLKPAVCSRELCSFAFTQLGVMSDAADDIATGAEVVDLLVCMTIAAARSNRCDQICDPYPTVLDPENPKVQLFSPKSKDWKKLNQVLDCFPNASSSKAKQSALVQEDMDRRHKHAWPLLQWIISSNRSHLVKIPQNKQIHSMGTKYQYLLMSAPPEREEKFQQLKKKYGAHWAFHGSRAENWHSILRNGLKNASGTKLQLNGAAYGAGIYLALDCSISLGYSQIYGGQGKGNSKEEAPLSVENFNCIAICEVVDHDVKKSGSIWVHPHEDHVITRFFFVYRDNDTSKASSCSTNNKTFIKELTNAIEASNSILAAANND